MKFLPLLVVLIAPASCIAQQGAWDSDVFFFSANQNTPIDAINAIHLIHVYDPATAGTSTTGKFLAFTFEGTVNPTCMSPRNRLWTPPDINSPGSPGTFETVELCRTDIFCAGHSALADGRLFCAGGDYSVGGVQSPPKHADVFDPFIQVGSKWNNPVTPPDMSSTRFYPTCTTLGDGRVLVTSGTINATQLEFATIPELYQPITNTWSSLPSAAAPSAA